MLSVEQGFARCLFSLISAAVVTSAIIRPEFKPGAWVRNGGRSKLSAGSTISAIRRCEIDPISETASAIWSAANPAMMALAAGDRDGFLQIERDVRAELGLPPFGRMAALIMSAPDAGMAKEIGQLAGKAAPHGDGITVYGPAPAPIGVVRGRHRLRFLVTAPRDVDLSAYMAAWLGALKLPNAARVSADIDPYSFL